MLYESLPLNSSYSAKVKGLRARADLLRLFSLMEVPAERKNTDVIHAFMGEVKTSSARKSLEVADEMANLVLFYARVRDNAEELEKAWEA